jgi:hypothetical protein
MVTAPAVGSTNTLSRLSGEIVVNAYPSNQRYVVSINLQVSYQVLKRLLPLSKEPSLSLRSLRAVPTQGDGPSTSRRPRTLIEEWTGGMLKNIKVVLWEPESNAIEPNESAVPVQVLARAWTGIAASKLEDEYKENNPTSGRKASAR